MLTLIEAPFFPPDHIVPVEAGITAPTVNAAISSASWKRTMRTVVLDMGIPLLI